ncbi:MAG: hypothetical protein IT323_08650 [Anaerolineae bacterium]|nr:hypothetical protein [Anaerolineae bacterium]
MNIERISWCRRVAFVAGATIQVGAAISRSFRATSSYIVQRKLSFLFQTILVCMLSCWGAAYAVDLSVQPQVQVGTRATDNLRSTSADKEAAWGFDTGASAALTVASSTWSSVVTPGFNFRRFLIGENVDADEYNIRTKSRWNPTVNAIASLGFDYVRDSTLATEEIDLGERRNDIISRDTFNVQPSVQYFLSDQISVNLGLMFSDVSFEDRPGTSFSDYDYKQINAGVSYVLSEALVLYINTHVSEFVAGPKDTLLQNAVLTSGSAAQTYGGQLGAQYHFSPTLDVDFAIGSDLTKSKANTRLVFDKPQVVFDPISGAITFVQEQATVDKSSDVGLVANASIKKAFADSRAKIDYRRAVSPSSRGAQTVSDDIVLSLDKDISRRWIVGWRGIYNMQTTQTDALSNNVSTLNRDQLLLNTWVRYRITEELAVSASYRFIWNEYSNPQRSVYNNGLYVTFSYMGRPYLYSGF